MKVSFTDDADNDETLTSAATAEVETRPNGPVTGLPTISGTVQVEQTLTADTSGIADEDGLTGVSYSYQWMSNNGNDDTDIDGATDSTYAVSDDDVGQTIKVRVSFTDDRDNEETLTSAATDTVVARPNSPATELPTISGTAQAGETLTADISGINDEDGLASVSYSYQWLADDGEIQGATGSTSPLTNVVTQRLVSQVVRRRRNPEHRTLAPVGSPVAPPGAWLRATPAADTVVRSIRPQHPRTLGHGAAWCR